MQSVPDGIRENTHDFPIDCQQDLESAMNDRRKRREYPGILVASDIVRLLNIATASLIVVGLIALFMLGIWRRIYA
jgi:hypothetical protein